MLLIPSKSHLCLLVTYNNNNCHYHHNHHDYNKLRMSNMYCGEPGDEGMCYTNIVHLRSMYCCYVQ